MMRRITALFFFLGVYVLGFAENTRGREYILVLSSINFNEAWANNLYQNILDEFSSPGFHVEAEELSIPMSRRRADQPPQASGSSAWGQSDEALQVALRNRQERNHRPDPPHY